MTDDPIRLLEDEGSPLLKSLISAGREEEPQAAALRRTLVAVGVAGVLSTTSAAAASSAATAAGASGTPAVGALASGSASAGAAATSTVVAAGAAKGVASSSLVIVAKWLAIGALTGTVASSAVYGVSGVLTPAPVASSASRVETTLSAPQVLPRPPSVRDELREIPSPPAVEVAPRAPTAAAAPPSPEPSAERGGGSLAAEVTALDGARQALGAGDASRALELLNGYEARFREPRMLPEALYLRLEAFTLKGDRSSAEAVARRILLVYPTSPHAARARTVLGLDK